MKTKNQKPLLTSHLRQMLWANSWRKAIPIFRLLLACALFLLPFGEVGRGFAQNIGINTAGASPHASAVLDIDVAPTNDKGLLVPRVTTVQRNAIVSPALSLLIFNTTTDCFEAWNQNTLTWVAFGCIGCQLPGAFSATAASGIAATSFSANWSGSSGAAAYYLDVSTVSNFASFVAGYNNLNVGNVATSSVTGLTCGTYYYRVRSTNTCGTSTNSGTIAAVITVPAQPSVITGTSPVCQGNNGIAYSVTNLAGVTYTWTYSGIGYTQASGGTTNSITANFSGAATSGTLTVTPSNACGNGTAQTLAITVRVTPTTANAGSDINPACGVTTATLAGNTATVGTGAWSVVSGTATITTPSSPTSGVTGLNVSCSATLRWTISNAPCTASTDNVVITTTACGGPPPCTYNSSSFTGNINHTIGTLAPETKTVNYGQIQTSLSGASKCWITQNLGSTNQASSATDNTDASAGWYWQFNRKQGYKVGPTPAWTITAINEASDWLAANDPCTIALGANWRIPTTTEWTNVDANSCSWANYTDAYNSVLKLHAAGGLQPSNGALGVRGVEGLYQSSTQNSNTNGNYMLIHSAGSNSAQGNKAFGWPIRCIRD